LGRGGVKLIICFHNNIVSTKLQLGDSYNSRFIIVGNKAIFYIHFDKAFVPRIGIEAFRHLVARLFVIGDVKLQSGLYRLFELRWEVNSPLNIEIHR
jgi:hypothetical protein